MFIWKVLISIINALSNNYLLLLFIILLLVEVISLHIKIDKLREEAATAFQKLAKKVKDNNKE